MTRTGSHRKHGVPRGGRRSRWSRRARILSALLGCLLVGGVAFAASSWIVGLNSSSSGQAQAGTVITLETVLVEALGQRIPPIRRLALPDAFPHKYGSQNDLLETAGLMPNQIAATVAARVGKQEKVA